MNLVLILVALKVKHGADKTALRPPLADGAKTGMEIPHVKAKAVRFPARDSRNTVARKIKVNKEEAVHRRPLNPAGAARVKMRAMEAREIVVPKARPAANATKTRTITMWAPDKVRVHLLRETGDGMKA